MEARKDNPKRVDYFDRSVTQQLKQKKTLWKMVPMKDWSTKLSFLTFYEN